MTEDVTVHPPKPPLLPKSTLILSRPSYRAGGTVVGTLMMENVALAALASIDLVVVGYARLDARWHRVTSYPFPPDHFHIGEDSKNYWDLPRASNIFWTSDLADLSSTPTFPEYVNQPPQDLRTPQPLHSIPKEKDLATMEVSRDLQRALSDKNLTRHQFRSYSFSVQLPHNLPPSLVATSCRFYYTVLHRLRFAAAGSASHAPPWNECPFVVTSPPHQQEGSQGTGTDNLASSKPPIRAVSHGDTLLCTLKSTELYDASATGLVAVHDNGPTMFRSVGGAGLSQDYQSMRVSNPAGQPVAVLSVLGAHTLSPGGRLLLQFDFPDPEENLGPSSSSSSAWAPCYQASACLQGEEVARQWMAGRGGTPTKRTRARKLLLATAHQVVDPACAERVCLSLLVPSDAPCSLQTDIVEISIWCMVDLTVGVPSETNGSRTKGRHQNLRLEIPCRLQHPPSATESRVLLQEDEWTGDTEFVDDSFYANEIRGDLQQLSYAALQKFCW